MFSAVIYYIDLTFDWIKIGSLFIYFAKKDEFIKRKKQTYPPSTHPEQRYMGMNITT